MSIMLSSKPVTKNKTKNSSNNNKTGTTQIVGSLIDKASILLHLSVDLFSNTVPPFMVNKNASNSVNQEALEFDKTKSRKRH